ncbi:MAG: hypothetical protein M3477_00170 [Gemmatimonadota bacterium]|nr:hypothetical protein [Gemmatimonadota bacterium]
MRNYWVRVFLGALAVFGIGMVGVTLVRHGVAKVNHVVEGDGPITIPLAFVPFQLGGDRLGTLQHLVLHRDAPRRVTDVKLHVKTADSLVARGLEGCRLGANFDRDRSRSGFNINSGPAFWCIQGDSLDSAFVEYGQAIFEPGTVTVPLFLPADLVSELQDITFSDSTAESAEEQADSFAAKQERTADSMSTRAERLGDSLRAEGRRRGDSLRAEGHRLSDSVRPAVSQMADSLPRP